MSEPLLIMITIAAVILILGVVVAIIVWKKREEDRKRGKPQKVDYRAFFGVGVVFLPAGVALMISTKNPGMLGIAALGVIYMIMGLSHKDEWENVRKGNDKPTKPVKPTKAKK